MKPKKKVVKTRGVKTTTKKKVVKSRNTKKKTFTYLSVLKVLDKNDIEYELAEDHGFPEGIVLLSYIDCDILVYKNDDGLVYFDYIQKDKE